MTVIRRLRSILLIINYKTLIVTVLAIFSTWLCGQFGIKANLPLTLVGIAIVFPVVFSIDSAFKRRERLLVLIGDMRAHLSALYLAARDWLPQEKAGEMQGPIKQQVTSVYAALTDFCTGSNQELEAKEKSLSNKLFDLSSQVQRFRDKGMYLGELSRINQYISKVMVDVESIKGIRRYPTPVTLRAYSKVFIFSFPILYGPYFNYIGDEISHNLEYMMPIVFSFILVSLDNIQVHLENPFDQIGEDDIHFRINEFNESLN